MRPVVTSVEMRAIEATTIRDIGIAAEVLMETAGRAVAAVCARRPSGAPIAILVGRGHNGGDGLVAARVLASLGRDVDVYLLWPRQALAPACAHQLAVFERCGGAVREVADQLDACARGLAELPAVATIVDAIFGIGQARALPPGVALVIDAANRASAYRVAVDVPTGLAADTGAALGQPFRADATVTFAASKLGLETAPGYLAAGVVEIADIGIPAALFATAQVGAAVLTLHDAREVWPRAQPLEHKGSRGHVAIIGGIPELRGAAWLAGLGAARAGAGLVTVGLVGTTVPEASAADASLMRRAVPDAEAVAALLVGKAACALGPGLGRAAAAAAIVAAGTAADLPLVLDADALAHLGRAPEQLRARTASTVLTPHPKEAARLLGLEVAEVERDRVAAARLLAQRSRAVVVLKGARTVICDGALGDGFCAINPTGGPALATGGSGDVLAGVIASVIAQGVPAASAARIATFVHGLAGERLATTWGNRGAIATDLPAMIAHVIAEITAG